MLLLLDKLVLGVDLGLSIELGVSFLLFLGVLTVYLGVFNFFVLSTVSIYFFSDIGYVLDSLTTPFPDLPFLSTV